MHKKLMTLIMSIALLAAFSTAALAQDVYVTKYGKKYHKKESRFIKGKEVEKITVEEAEDRGLEPSSDFLEEDESSDKESAK